VVAVRSNAANNASKLLLFSKHPEQLWVYRHAVMLNIAPMRQSRS